MLKNVMVSKLKLEEQGFIQQQTDKYHTEMRKGKYLAKVLPNGNVEINGVVTPYKAVKRGKLNYEQKTNG